MDRVHSHNANQDKDKKLQVGSLVSNFLFIYSIIGTENPYQAYL